VDKEIANQVLTSSSVVVAHGTPTPVVQLIDYLGFHYPNLTTVDWKTGGRFCEAVV
jgi:hypothetical protein